MAVGKKVRLHILLDWDLTIPDGVIRGMLQLIPRREQIAYLVELESELTIEAKKKGLFSRRNTAETTGTKFLVVAIRRIEAAEEELHGRVLSELTAPLFYYPRNPDVVSRSELRSKEDLAMLGPGQIEVIGLEERSSNVPSTGR